MYGAHASREIEFEAILVHDHWIIENGCKEKTNAWLDMNNNTKKEGQTESKGDSAIA